MRFNAVLLVLFCTSIIYAQTEYVDIYNPVYQFLERMENENFLPGYNSFEIPKTRNEIASYLKIVKDKEPGLIDTDKDFLNDLLIEFGYDISGTTSDSKKLINNNDYNYFSDNQKYLYYNTSPDFNIFINLIAGYNYLHENQKGILNNNASIGNLGGIIRGSINNKFGFLLKGTNGIVSGNKRAALSLPQLAQNFKFNEKPEETFYDETEGYLTADFNYLKFKLGRDKIKIGYGELTIVDDYSPAFDYLSLNINYEFFSYSYIHAKMIDIISLPEERSYTDKFMVYHRIGFNLSRHFDFGVGEFVIYGRRGIDLSYLNPFAFFKSIEHSNRDRDNTMLFLDINNNSIPSTKIYFNLLLDDISYGKIGTGWWGNQVFFQGGFITSNILSIPLDIKGSYRRTEPYVFTHKLSYNNFANFGYGLGVYDLPNSELFHGKIIYRLNYRLEFSSAITYIRHGANSGGKNYGGDLNFGHREIDGETIKFMEGSREYYRNYDFGLSYEPFNQILFKLSVAYSRNSILINGSQEEIQSLFTLVTTF